MALSDLAPEQQEAARQCLRYVLESRQLEDELDTRLGVTKEEVSQLLATWPVDDSDDESIACIAINNSFNEVLNGLDISHADWSRSFAVDPEELSAIYKTWATSRGWKATGIR
jgi:hypothetical protein